MAKAVGSEKSGGRKKGTPNKRSLGFGEVLAERGIDLLEEILEEAKTLTASERVSVYVSLLPYQYPKRKPTESQPPLSIDDYINSLDKREMAKLKNLLSEKMGENRPWKEYSMEELREFNGTIEELLQKQVCLDALKDDPWSA